MARRRISDEGMDEGLERGWRRSCGAGGCAAEISTVFEGTKTKGRVLLGGSFLHILEMWTPRGLSLLLFMKCFAATGKLTDDLGK